MLMLAAYLLALLGFAQLALSQERHCERVLDRFLEPHSADQRSQRVRRALGFAATVLALPLCLASEGAALGSLLWVVLLSAAAMTVALTLTWRPLWLKPLLSRAGPR